MLIVTPSVPLLRHVSQVKAIAGMMPHGDKRQTVLFSATWPREVRGLAARILQGSRNPTMHLFVGNVQVSRRCKAWFLEVRGLAAHVLQGSCNPTRRCRAWFLEVRGLAAPHLQGSRNSTMTLIVGNVNMNMRQY